MVTFDKTVRQAELNSGYLNLTDDNGTTHGYKFPPPRTPLTIVTNGSEYFASINAMQNQIWGGLKRWFRDENIHAGDKINISYDTLQSQTDRVRIEIRVNKRTFTPATAITTIPIETPTIAQTIEKTFLEEEKEEENGILIDKKQFAYEEDLRNFLVRNLSELEQGLKLYEEDGVTGEEFVIPGTLRRIDIFALDKDNNHVVIELKVSRGYEKVVGQALFYQSSIRTHFQKSKVRVIIVAREITRELMTATHFLPDFELFEYQLSLTLNKIN